MCDRQTDGQAELQWLRCTTAVAAFACKKAKTDKQMDKEINKPHTKREMNEYNRPSCTS